MERSRAKWTKFLLSIWHWKFIIRIWCSTSNIRLRHLFMLTNGGKSYRYTEFVPLKSKQITSIPDRKAYGDNKTLGTTLWRQICPRFGPFVNYAKAGEDGYQKCKVRCLFVFGNLSSSLSVCTLRVNYKFALINRIGTLQRHYSITRLSFSLCIEATTGFPSQSFTGNGSFWYVNDDGFIKFTA